MNDPTLPTTTTNLGGANAPGASTGDQAGSVAPAAPQRRGRKSVAGGDQAAADDATLPQTIPASEADPEPAPPCAGSWLREADGSLRPRDEGTARAAGLAWPS